MTKRVLASTLGVSVRFIEDRISERPGTGPVMPSRMLAGKRQFQLSVVESFLRDHGYLEDSA